MVTDARQECAAKPVFRMAAARSSGLSRRGITCFPARSSCQSGFVTSTFSSRTTRIGFPARKAVRISLKQFGDSIARSDRKKTTFSQPCMCCAMLAGQSLPAGMPSSYHRR